MKPSATRPDSLRRVLAGAVLAAALPPARPARAADGDAPWPDLPLRTEAGEPLLGEPGRWRAVYVDFWASWCTPCRLSFPWMNEMHERLAPASLRIVAVNLDRRDADARRFLQRHPARFALAFDPAADSARRLDVQAMPTSVLVTPGRRIAWTHRGFRAEDAAALEARLRAAVGA